MLRLTSDQLQPGMVIAQNIYNAAGQVLLAKSVILDKPIIAKLREMGIDSVFINNPYLNIEPQDIIYEKTRVETIKLTHNAFESFGKTKMLNVVGIQDMIKKVVEDILDNRHAVIQLTDIRARDDYTFGHSINVCLLSTMIGAKLHLTEHQLFELALGAILHDLGMMLVPPDIFKKPSCLSPEERQAIREHPEQGFDILRKIGPIPLLSANVAYQHHENFDGSGYPRKLSGEEIHKYARIVAVADLYDAVTSDRAYRKASLPHEAYEIMIASRTTKLDPVIVDAFLENVALYPIGTTVLIDTGEIGVIIDTYPKLSTRPVIKIITDEFGNSRNGVEKVIDFTKDLTRFVVRVLSPEEIFKLDN